MKDQIRALEEDALAQIASAADRDGLEAVRTKYLGRKGLLTEIFKKIGEVSDDERPVIGSLINEVKLRVTAALEEKLSSSAGSSRTVEKIDITLPGVKFTPGATHPITKAINDICDCFISLGFMIVEGPEIETEHYNFEALNIPLEHPSRDAFDTFYLHSVSGTSLLRSHTSPVQARFMEQNKPPFAIVVPGRVFRPDATDATHSFMFHQVEGLVVGSHITFSDLKGVLGVFARQMFGEDTQMRFRPSFFPFTEPSAEVDISCFACQKKASQTQGVGKRCSVCGGRGWLEILGAGMVNPKVFKNVGYDPEKVTGFAFGMGVERIAMLKYGVSDIRLFFENDVRFLHQF